MWNKYSSTPALGAYHHNGPQDSSLPSRIRASEPHLPQNFSSSTDTPEQHPSTTLDASTAGPPSQADPATSLEVLFLDYGTIRQKQYMVRRLLGAGKLEEATDLKEEIDTDIQVHRQVVFAEKNRRIKMPQFSMMQLSTIVAAHPRVPIVHSETEAKEIKPTMGENIRNLRCESQVRLILESELEEVKKLLKEGKYEDAEKARLRLVYSAEAERAENANPIHYSMTRTQIMSRLDSVQQTALTVTKKIESKMGIENPTGDSFKPLMLTYDQMERKGVGELYNRMHDLWYLTGLKYEALQGDEEARKRLELMEAIARKKALENLTIPFNSPAGKEQKPPSRIAIQSRLNDNGYNILLSSETIQLQHLENRLDGYSEPPTVPPQETFEIAEGSTGETDANHQKRKHFQRHWKRLKSVLKVVQT
ncbi:hypothetical protein TWF694_008032 [Orbilia ellipsospora]|uniref:Uncharacterized protein n=1 Tax=Orbilia ellipsospora TaxID=2528407 RepID=A0AAV9XEW7_9PEZI